MLVPVLLFAVGLVLLIKGGDWFVDGATGLARRFHIPEIIVLNKADAADPFVLERMRQREPEHVIVSARTGEGIEELKQKIADTIPRPSIEVKLLIPYSHGEIISRLHEWDAEIKSTDFVSDGTFVVALVREDVASDLAEYVLEGDLLEVLEEELAEARALTEATASDSEQSSTAEAL